MGPWGLQRLDEALQPALAEVPPNWPATRATPSSLRSQCGFEHTIHLSVPAVQQSAGPAVSVEEGSGAHRPRMAIALGTVDQQSLVPASSAQHPLLEPSGAAVEEQRLEHEDQSKQFLPDWDEHKQKKQEFPEGQERQATDAPQHYCDFVQATLLPETDGSGKDRLIRVAAKWKKQHTMPERLAQENKSVGSWGRVVFCHSCATMPPGDSCTVGVWEEGEHTREGERRFERRRVQKREQEGQGERERERARDRERERERERE